MKHLLNFYNRVGFLEPSLQDINLKEQIFQDFNSPQSHDSTCLVRYSGLPLYKSSPFLDHLKLDIDLEQKFKSINSNFLLLLNCGAGDALYLAT